VIPPILRQLRPHQWVKNGLLALPALAGHLPWTPELGVRLLLAFTAFSALASAVYVFNDILDLETDRAHPSKRRRPLAAGEVTRGQAIAAGIICLAVAVALLPMLPRRFGVWLGVYAALTTLYNVLLQQRLLVDVVALASLYTCRIIAGAAAVDVQPTRWFLAFSVFVFFSLALVKRVIELKHATAEESRVTFGRRYSVQDVPVLIGLGTSATAAATLVYCLYISSEQTASYYRSPEALWAGLPLVLYWQARIWILAQRGVLHDDPVVFALRDRTSYIVAAAFLLIVWLATQPLPTWIVG
jgi:4-hydroxybenzoate polyprenyltransferase